MITVYSILASLLPTAIYAAIIYWADRYEKEPVWLLFLAFFWGAIPSIIGTIYVAPIVEPFLLSFFDESLRSINRIVVVAPILEEVFKGGILLAILFIWSHEIDSWLDGIVYGAMVGLGFAMVENYFYFTSEYATGGISAWSTNVFFRGGVFGLNHALFSSLLGLGMAVGALTHSASLRLFAPIAGLVAAIATHALHNALVMGNMMLFVVAPIADWAGIFAMTAIVIWALVQEQRWITHYLKDEVGRGTLSTNQYEMARSLRLRGAHEWHILVHFGFGRFLQTRHFYHQCSRLAAKKHHTDIHPEDHIDVTKLRATIHQLSQQI